MAIINIRVTDSDKKDLEEILGQIGLNLSVATNAFYKQVIMQGKIPFELKADPFYSKKNISRLEKSISQLNQNGGTIHEVIKDD
ncbi:damage-inducible protein [Campylobacter mucosalis]|uniref:type II toxin-antitoxin system RelB/DinJ family antitoxin n=1 Tax=Campylobacter mucosalis TaxID=202 RepID=UPI0004D6E96E|nr:type II toxin-antitoxin system RelB/DinJ family antitoxin [Campylobacter mucosalis]KEA46228.1 damage-inducible protein [Campylobacter mucosalis]QKF62686.1 toxin-antitoxin system, antitoxin component, RelB family [Campylobacter mucosalis]